MGQNNKFSLWDKKGKERPKALALRAKSEAPRAVVKNSRKWRRWELHSTTEKLEVWRG